MDEVIQHGAALMERVAALTESLDGGVTNLSAAMPAFKLVGKRHCRLRRFASRSERLRTEFKPRPAVPAINELSRVCRNRRA